MSTMANLASLLRTRANVRRLWVRTVISAAAGLAVFLGAYQVFSSLEGSLAGPSNPAAGVETLVSRPGLFPSDSMAARVASGRVAVSVPAASQEVLAGELRPGDRLDIVALVPGGSAQPRLAAVAVRGAMVLSRNSGAGGESLLVEVTPEEGMVLGHLVLSGVRLQYALWSASSPPPPVPPLDVETARGRLGLPPGGGGE